ncbi:MAG: magnesium transporter [Phycisphaerales bacterium]|nr:MAG: magnesium transporter [Phycisphaerales bacterium]
MKNNLILQELRAMLARGESDRLARAVTTLHPVAVAHAVEEMDINESGALLEALQPKRRGEVFAHLSRPVQRTLLMQLDTSFTGGIVANMPHDDRVDVLRDLPNKDRVRAIMSGMPAAERADIERLSGYGEGVAGSVMTSEFTVLRIDMTVGEAIEHLRTDPRGGEMAYYLYVLDEQRRLTGIVSLRDMLLAKPERPIRELMRKEVVSCRAGDDVNDVARLLKEYDLIALPVINGGDEMVGIVTFDDVIDVIEEETSDTMYMKAGVGDLVKSKDHVYSERLTNGSVWYPIRVRILFLMVTLVGGLLVGGLIDRFEETLMAVMAAAVFIPLIMDMGGNVGTQSTTIFARGYALGHIELSRMFSHVRREMLVGVIMGLILGTIGGTVAYLWQGAPNGVPQLGVAVGVSLFTVVTLATALGFLLPWLMIRIGVDHAPGADPFITTIKDFTGLALFFVLVATLIGVPEESEDVATTLATKDSVVLVDH